MRRFPAPFAALLQERAVCGGLLLAGLILGVANACGIHLWHCAFLEATGKPCPGCGLTRGMTALCRGDLPRALRFHPFTPLFALGGLVMVLSLALPGQARQRLISGMEALEKRTGLTALILLALLAFGLWRIFTGRMPGE